jgi:hypothetical protein
VIKNGPIESKVGSRKKLEPNKHSPKGSRVVQNPFPTPPIRLLSHTKKTQKKREERERKNKKG